MNEETKNLKLMFFFFLYQTRPEFIADCSQVYGEDWWLFIEDSCYEILLENILEKMEGEENKVSP